MQSILLLAALIAVLVFVSWYKRAPKAQRQRVTNRILVIGGIGVLLALILTGRLNPVFGLIAAAVPLAYRALGFFQLAQSIKGAANAFKGTRGPTPGQTSDVETHFLRMTLNHDTGDMDGEVLEGNHRGKRLSSLKLSDLLDLLAECRGEDAQSAAVLEAYLERNFGEEWREAASDQGDTKAARGDGKMSVQEAREILGVDSGASPEQITEAHRRLMQKLHPDRGGSTYLAAKINEAKRILLEGAGTGRSR